MASGLITQRFHDGYGNFKQQAEIEIEYNLKEKEEKDRFVGGSASG